MFVLNEGGTRSLLTLPRVLCLWESLTFLRWFFRYAGTEGIEGKAAFTILNVSPSLSCLTPFSTLSHPRLSKWFAKRCAMGPKPWSSGMNLFWEVWSLVFSDIEMLENHKVQA